MNQLLLAIDAATAHGGVAVGAGGTAIAEVGLGDTRRHSELLLPAVEFALRAAGAQRSDLAGIVVGAGPGSFTGVRIAAATAKGLAAGLGIPLYAYSSLAALAAAAGRGASPVCAMFDAKRGEVYAGCYAFTNRIETILSPVAAPIGDVLHMLPTTGVMFAGEGAVLHAAETQVSASGSALVPRPGALLWLAELDPAAGVSAGGAAFEPTYVRASAAERQAAR